MNAADEHGIIHPGTCPSPINGVKRPTSTAKDNTPADKATSAPGDDSSLKSKPITDSQPPSSVTRSEAPNVEGGGDAKKEAVAGGAPQAAGEVIRPILLSALQELSEIARPEIAASALVAGACKVTWLVDQREPTRVYRCRAGVGGVGSLLVTFEGHV